MLLLFMVVWVGIVKGDELLVIVLGVVIYGLGLLLDIWKVIMDGVLKGMLNEIFFKLIEVGGYVGVLLLLLLEVLFLEIVI